MPTQLRSSARQWKFGRVGACYLGVQALQVGTDVLDAGSERVDVQERRNDP